MNKDDLAKIMADHGKWLLSRFEGKRANLSGANLSGANLSGANLSRANLSRADLTGAYLTGAYLYEAYLTGANLSGANLSRANLSRADLYEAYLTEANLSRANLSRADLTGAYLTGANLSGAKLCDVEITPGSAVISGAFDHGWPLFLLRHTRGIGVMCGCRWFEQVAPARAHWLAHKNEQRRQVVLPALDALLSIAKAQGWDVPETEGGKP